MYFEYIDVEKKKECINYDGIRDLSQAGSSGAFDSQEWERAYGHVGA
mgnify:CR=1 FL=1